MIFISKLSSNEIEYIISRVLDNAKDTFEDTENSEFVNGKKLAYYEVLDTIKNELMVRDVNLEDYGLNFNLEELL